jgi:hypothetical protein
VFHVKTPHTHTPNEMHAWFRRSRTVRSLRFTSSVRRKRLASFIPNNAVFPCEQRSFAKTGSGQTQRKLSTDRSTVFCSSVFATLPIGNMVSSMGEAATIESLQYLRNASQTHAGKCVHIQLMTPQVRRPTISRCFQTHHSLIQWRV